MEDATDYGNDIFTVQKARALAASVAAALRERDRLREEIETLRLIMAEFQALYAFLDHAPAGAMAASAQTNGSVHDHGPTNTARVQADDQGEDLRNDDSAQADAAGKASSVDIVGDVDTDSAQAAAPSVQTPAAMMEADERHDEREACAANILYDPPSQFETPADERQGEQASGETGTAQRPPQGSLMARILELIEASDRPKRPWQVQKELNLPRLPSAELSRLLTMGCLTRPKEGIYAVPGRNYGGLG